MPKTRPPYPSEFRDQIVALARSGRSVAELAREFEPSEQTIYTWIAQAERKAGKPAESFATGGQDELSQLRKENRRLRQERDILAKAAAWFAQETHSTSKRSSDS